MDDPRENVPDALEERLDDLSSTLTDDDVRTEYGSEGGGWAAEADTDETDADADDTDVDQDADADDAGL